MVTSPAPDTTPSYAALQSEADRCEVVFRVHSQLSASPLYWTGRAETSGFCSPNRHLALLTPGAYAAALEPLEPPRPRMPPPQEPPVLIPLDEETAGESSARAPDIVVGVPFAGFERDPSIRQSLVDHCTRRSRPSNNWGWTGPDMAADDYSSWISTTASLRWAVWEAAHRLVHIGEDRVDIAVVGTLPVAGAGARPPLNKSHIQKLRVGASGEVVLEPYLPLCDHKRFGLGTGSRARMTNSEKEAVQNAIYMARTSEEVLFYGRIFASSVKANLTFTADHLPLMLPPQFFFGASQRWVDDLVWDPLRDSYENACKKMAANAGAKSASGSWRGPGALSATTTGSWALNYAPATAPSNSASPARRPTQHGPARVEQQRGGWPTPAPAAAAGLLTRPQTSQPRTYSSTVRPVNHYSSAGHSVPPAFLSSTNAVPLGRRRDAHSAITPRRPLEW